MSKLTIATLLATLVVAAVSSSAAAPAACPRFEVTLVRPKASSDTRPVRSNGGVVHVDRAPIVSIDDITEAKFGDPDDLNGAGESMQIKILPGPAERLEQITADPKGVQLAVVLNDTALLNVFFSGGYGIGRDGMQIHTDDPGRIKDLPAVLNRCSAAIAMK